MINKNLATAVVTIYISMMFLSSFAFAQAGSSSDVASSLVDMLGLPDAVRSEIAGNSGLLITYIVVPWLMMFVILWGVIGEIKIFTGPRSSMINFAIALLGSVMLIPTGVLSKIVLTVYGGGFATILLLIGFGIIPRFIDVFAERLGFSGHKRIFGIITGVIYGGAIAFAVNSVFNNLGWGIGAGIAAGGFLVWRAFQHGDLGMRTARRALAGAAQSAAASQRTDTTVVRLLEACKRTSAALRAEDNAANKAAFARTLENLHVASPAEYGSDVILDAESWVDADWDREISQHTGGG